MVAGTTPPQLLHHLPIPRSRLAQDRQQQFILGGEGDVEEPRRHASDVRDLLHCRRFIALLG